MFLLLGLALGSVLSHAITQASTHQDSAGLDGGAVANISDASP